MSAGRLRDRLKADFSVFLDQETLKPGDKWPRVIENEAAQCEVFVAFIGPDWANDENLRRLDDEEDWVHKELLLAIRTSRALIIPVVIIDRETFKRAMAKLPEPLKALTSDQAVFIDQDTWTSQVDDLCQHLQHVLAERQSGRGGSPVRLQLPYLCDRGEHVDGLQTKLLAAAGQKTLAYVLSGRNLDGHQAFVDRLRSMHILENAFQAAGGGVGFYELEFMREMAKRKDYAGFLRWGIRRRVLQSPQATDAQIDDLLRNPGLATVLVLEINWEDRQTYGDDLVPRLVDAWFNLFGQPAVVPSRPMLFWINLACSEEQEPEVLASDYALPNLTPIDRRDIGTWLARPEVRPHVVKFEARLRTIHDDARWLRPVDKTLSMLRFAEAVNSITNGA